MTKKHQHPKKQNITPTQPQANSKIKAWLPLLAFIAVGILIFYPPYFRGLFFNEDMFITHIITAIVFTIVWADKIYRKDYTFIKTPLDWAILAYAGAYLLSLITAVHPGEAFYGFLRALNYFMIYWLVTQIVKDYKAYENILRILLASGLGVAAIGIMAATGYSDYPSAFDGRQIMSTLQYPNTTAAYLAVLSLIGITLWTREKNIFMKFIYALSTSIMILVILGTTSKGAWLIFIIGALLLLLGMPSLIYRLKALYGLGVAFLAALITSRGFVPAITGDDPASGLIYLWILFAIILVGQILWEVFLIIQEKRGTRFTLAIAATLILLTFTAVFLQSNIEANDKNILPENIAQELTRFTNFEDSSYQARADFNRWGLAIVKDYSITGAGAGGWNALYHQYQDYLIWTTEAHNHFMQVWVEAGTLGLLSFLAIWTILIYYLFILYKAYRKESENHHELEEAQEKWILTWGVAAAALAFGAHSAIDFNLSLSAMAILLWTLFALISASYSIEKQADAWGKIPAVNISLAIILMATLLITGISYYSAHNNAQQGSLTLTHMLEMDGEEQYNELLKGIAYYEKATSLDSNSASYAADIAYVYTLMYQTLSSAQHAQADHYYRRAIDAVNSAIKLSPYDTKVLSSLISTSSSLGNLDIILEFGELTVKANPWDINAYEAQIQIYNAVLEHYQSNNEDKKALEIAKEIIKVIDQINKQNKKKNPDRISAQEMNLSEKSIYTLTKSAIYTNAYKKAQEILDPFVKNLLLLEFSDPYFTNTEMEDENWLIRRINDSEAKNGSAIEIKAKEDMQGWPTVLNLANSIPVSAGTSYKLAVRYRIIYADNSPDGETGPYIGIWGTTSGVNTSFSLHNRVQHEETNWQTSIQTLIPEEGMNNRNLRIGTGSISKGTRFQIDYIELTVDLDNSINLSEELQDIYMLYAVAIYKQGETMRANEIINSLKKFSPQVEERFNKYIK